MNVSPPTEYEYYYDYTPDSTVQEADLTLDDWLYELVDVTGKIPLLLLQNNKSECVIVHTFVSFTHSKSRQQNSKLIFLLFVCDKSM